MKRSFLLFIALMLPVQPIMAQQATLAANQQPPIANTWLARVTNNFTKLPSWVNLDRLKNIPQATWQRINKLFGGFKIQTFVGAIRLEEQCNRIRHYDLYSKRKVATDKILALISRDAKGNYIFLDYPKFRVLISENSLWIRSYYNLNKFIGSLDPAEMKGLFKSLKVELDQVLDRLKADYAVKNYIETGENICDKVLHPLKIVLLAYRDILAIILLIIGIIMGIAFSPEIYAYYKKRLFKAQVSQQDLPLSAPLELQRADENRERIERQFAQTEGRVRDILEQADVAQLLTAGNISTDQILYLGESHEKTAQYIRRHLEELQPARGDITQIGIIASMPYIKDDHRWDYINRLRHAGVKPTELDQDLMLLLEEKIGNPARTKSAAKR